MMWDDTGVYGIIRDGAERCVDWARLSKGV